MTTLRIRRFSRDPVTTYLRRATLGLPAHVAQEVRDELEEHLLCRAAQLEYQGLSPTDALARAVRELGPPGHVTAGMNKVHNMPRLILGAVLTALTASAMLYAAAGGAASRVQTIPLLAQRPAETICLQPEPGITFPPAQFTSYEKGGRTCYVPRDPAMLGGAFLSATTLRDTLQRQGMARSIQQGKDGTLIVDAGTSGYRLPPSFTLGGEYYYDAGALIVQIMERYGAEGVQLSGFRHPEVRFTDQALRFGTGDQVIGPGLYASLSHTFLQTLSPIRPDPFGRVTVQGAERFTHRVQTALPAGTVIMVVTRRDPSELKVGPTTPAPREVYETSFTEVARDGSVTFKSDRDWLRFVKSFGQLQPEAVDRRIQTLLVRVTDIPLGKLKSGILVPAQPTSDAR